MKAAIDIGTNTVLLLVGEKNNDKLEIAREEQRMPRLGEGVDANDIISKKAAERVITAIQEYQEIIKEEYSEVDEIIVTATSAVRDASNKQALLKEIKERTGLEVRILSGSEEAEWTAVGALSVVEVKSHTDTFILDIGGGSTEVALVLNDEVKDRYSYDMGCVRFTERYLEHDPPYQEEISECREAIDLLFKSRKFKPSKKVEAVGVAGTVTSLASLDKGIEEYDPDVLNGHIIKGSELSKSLDIFRLHTHEQLLELNPKVLKDREDIFLAGLLILEGFMMFYKLSEIKVSTGGIRHGAILLHS